jgi:hypothetical protein
VEELEIDLLLEALFQRHGYDFRDYDRHRCCGASCTR